VFVGVETGAVTTLSDTPAGGGDPVMTAPVQNDMQDLLDKAYEKVKAQYPTAILYTAMGKVPGGQGTQPGDVTKWRFVYDLDPKTLFLDYENGAFGTPVTENAMWVGDCLLRKPVGRGLTEAVTLLRGAGYTGAFSEAVLRQPLQPIITEPYYIFTMTDTGAYIFVGVESGKVFDGTRASHR
jgi:hypothetical protein